MAAFSFNSAVKSTEDIQIASQVLINSVSKAEAESIIRSAYDRNKYIIDNAHKLS